MDRSALSLIAPTLISSAYSCETEFDFFYIFLCGISFRILSIVHIFLLFFWLRCWKLPVRGIKWYGKVFCKVLGFVIWRMVWWDCDNITFFLIQRFVRSWNELLRQVLIHTKHMTHSKLPKKIYIRHEVYLTVTEELGINAIFCINFFSILQNFFLLFHFFGYNRFVVGYLQKIFLDMLLVLL